MTEDEYIEQIEELVKKINSSKEVLFRMVRREEFEAAATLKKHIEEDQQELLKLLSGKSTFVNGVAKTQ